MEQIRLGDQIIVYDRERTKAAYAAMTNGSAERCGCPYCRNFVVQRSIVYPEQFRLLLERLGIDPEKEGEVYEGKPEGSLISYGGWFYLAGELIEPGEQMTDFGALQYFFRPSHKAALQEDFGDEVLALEFSLKLPWVIPEGPEWQ